MGTESAAVDDPEALVPGNPASVWEMAGSLGGIGVALEEIGAGFRGIDDGGWQGVAADAFRACFERQPSRFMRAADAFGDAALALDSYASALGWAQRQAVEAVALAREPRKAQPLPPLLSVAQQARQYGLVASSGEREVLPFAPRPDASDTLARAREQLHRIGCAAAGKVRAAAEVAPLEVRLLEAIAPPPVVVPRPGGRPLVLSTIREDRGGLMLVKQHLDHDTLRDLPGAWDAGVARLRRVMRLGLDQLSPRLRQHLFDGHIKKRKQGNGYRELGYHHREGGVDRGPVRVVRVVAGPDVNGVYRARVAGPRTDGGSEFRISTFFPDSWSRADVLRAVRDAFLGRIFFDV
ncbi:putative T7SS-secreted protein, partial [Actinophytocola sp.]|uniref:putative T7SS-secreted protein n=1 Tax=Actinophytocola sp. TaxID=1872138 RepID=UPI00389997AC